MVQTTGKDERRCTSGKLSAVASHNTAAFIAMSHDIVVCIVTRQNKSNIHSDIPEDLYSGVLRWDAVSLDYFSPTFRRNIVPPSSRVEDSFFCNPQPVKMKALCSLETMGKKSSETASHLRRPESSFSNLPFTTRSTVDAILFTIREVRKMEASN